jgi:hypothetical protein
LVYFFVSQIPEKKIWAENFLEKGSEIKQKVFSGWFLTPVG